MELYFLRHGIAGNRDPKQFPDDRLRPLTDHGKAQIVTIAKKLKSFDIKFDFVVSSPYLRAAQTAELFAKVFKVNKECFKFTNLLASETNPKDLFKFLKQNRCSDSFRILVTGHEPFLSRLISKLLSGKKHLEIRLEKSAICKLTVRKLKKGSAAFHWLLPPVFFT